jgi:hypothetical protein
VLEGRGLYVVVVIGGMHRSGSTFSFNIVKETLAQTGPVEIVVGNLINSSVARAHNQHLVLKTHFPDEDILQRIKDGSVRCVCTIRRPADAIASLMRTFDFSLEQGIDLVKRWVDWYCSVWESVLSLDYHILDRQPRVAIPRIIEYMDCRNDEGLVEMLAARYEKSALKTVYDSLPNDERTVDMGYTYYDKETLFHRRHISLLDSRSAEFDLALDHMAQIRAELRGQFAALDAANPLRAYGEFFCHGGQ